MNYEVIIELVVRAVAVLIMAYVAPKLKAWLNANLDAKEMEMLDRLIKAFVEAAEQTVRTSGIDRKAYVVEQLKGLNYEITAEVDARIEAAVYGLKEH